MIPHETTVRRMLASNMSQAVLEKALTILKTREQAFVQKHKELTGASGFIYKGKTLESGFSTRTITELHESLVKDYQLFLDTYSREIENECCIGTSYISSVLTHCSCLGWVYDLVPEDFHYLLKQQRIEYKPTPQEVKDKVLQFNPDGLNTLKVRMFKNILEA